MIDKVINYRYEILEKIGEGSFFSVYKARDKVLNKLVAVKILLPQSAEDQEVAERIRAEASSVVGLTHPNIARIYESGEQDGVYFTVVEYVRGSNLKERIRRVAPFPLAQAIDIAIGIAEALTQAHAAGIVHGDIRPHNVIITPEGQVKVTDFGIAAALWGTSLVQSNAVLRHVHYMSPETAEGQIPQPASDMYSLGVILYEMLTGTVPFDGETPISIALKHVKEPPPSPRALNPGIPKAVEGIVLKALQKDPEMRYESLAKMLQDLRSVRDALRFGKSLSWSPIDPNATAPPIPVEEEEEPVSIVGAIFKTLAIVFGFVAVALGVGLLIITLTRPSDVRVPDVVGQTQAEAERTLQDMGFRVSFVPPSGEYSDTVPAGSVIRTNPPANLSVKKGSTVTVTVSRGPQYVQVPDVVGIPLSSARDILSKVNLSTTVSSEYNDSVESGSVISQDPGPGNMVSPQTRVKLRVSKGPAPVTEPTDGTAKIRDISINFDVPPGADPQHIRIVVVDDDGEQTVVEGDYSPGDNINLPRVEVKGQDVSVRYYLNDQLLKEEIK